MGKRGVLLCVLIALLAAPVALPAQAPPKTPPASAGEKAGNISALLPVAQIVRGAGERAMTSKASKGDELVWDDLVKTERGGRARITLVDQSILSLGSQAELKIVRHDGRSQQTAVQLGYGRLRAEVSKIVREGDKFELRTPTAVAGVIGTDFGADASEVGTTKFVCISGVVQVSNSDPEVPGAVLCEAGMTTSVSTGNPPTPPATASPEEIQQLIQDTEPAVISAMSPVSILAGSSVNAAVTGSKLAGVINVGVSGEGVSASLAGPPTNTAVTVHLEIGADAAPGPRTLTLTKENEMASAAVFTVLSPPGKPEPGEAPRDPYAEVFEQQRLYVEAGLSAYLAEVRQARDQALQMWRQANRAGIDLSQGIADLNAEIAAMEAAIESAERQTDAAAAEAVEGFDTQYQSAWNELQQRNPEGTPDDAFGEELQGTFEEVNTTLESNFNKISGDLATVAQTASDKIAQLQQTWLTSLTQQPPTPSVNNIERSIDVGAGFGSGNVAALDASNSKSASGASIVRYQWVLCDPSYKPAQFGVPIAATATGCNALSGFTSSSSDFSFETCGLNPGDYIARVTVYDSNSQASAMDVKVHVLAPTYDDPPSVVRNLAAAYTSLQMQQFLRFFDDTNFPGYDALAENIRNTFPTLGTMNINLVISQSSISCTGGNPAGDATVRADWELNYTFKKVCQPIPNTDPVQQACSDSSQVYQDKKQLSMRMARTPGKGWLITDFQGDNGTVQAKLPGPWVTDTSQPDLTVTAVYPSYATQGSTAALPVSSGTQSFTAVISNIGSAVLSAASSVRFQLLDSTGASVGSYLDVPLPAPLNAGASVPVSADLSVTGVPGTGFQVSATVNPVCTTAETTCANNSFARPLVIGAANFQLALAQPFSPAQNVLVGGSAQVPIALTETGGTYPLPITVGPANGSLSYTVPSSPMAPGTQTVTVTSSVGMVTGNFPLTLTSSSYGLAQSVTQPLNFVSAKIEPTNLLLNDASNPLEIQMGQSSLTMLPNVQLTLDSTFFSGSATVAAPPPTLGFNSTVDNGATTSIGPGGNFTWQITANYGASATVTPLTLSAQLPNSNPPAIVQYTLYVKAVGVPDLQIVSYTPSRSITSGAPWIDGEPIDFSVVVQNSGPVPSAGGEDVTCRLRGYEIGRTTAPSLAPGARATVNLHCIAPDIDGNNPASATVPFSVRIDPDRNGELNYANNKTADVYYPWSNWHVRVNCPCSPSGSGSGTASDPMRIWVMTGYNAPFWVTIDGYLDSGQVSPSATFGIAPGVFNQNVFNPQFPIFATSTGTIRFDQVRASAMAPTQSGIYILQAIVSLLDGTTATTQRQATIYVQITYDPRPVPNDFLTLTTSAHNCLNPSPDGGCANGPTPNTVQINGKLVEQLGLSVWRSGCVSTPCDGSVDLSFTDAANTATTPPLQTTLGFGQQHTIEVAALLDPDGVITLPGPAVNYTVSATGVQAPVGVFRAQTPSPSPAGITFQLAFNVGDINITPYNAACVNVVPGGASVTLNFNWQPVSGFNAPLQWEWQEANHVPVGAAPLSFTPSSGSDPSTTGVYSALPTFTLKNTQAIDGLQTYFFAVKVSNQFSSATKYYPFYFDLSTSQNFCGALLNTARGFGGARGTWSRSAAGGGGVTISAMRPRTTSTTSGQPDLRLSASDVSFTPSLPKVGDTIQVRFRVSNQGDADARGVPIALQVNGVSVAMDTFDVRAGSTTLAGLEWKAANLPSSAHIADVSSRPPKPRSAFRAGDTPDTVERGLPRQTLRVQLVIDPQHTIQQKTTLGKAAALAHFSLRDGGVSAGVSTVMAAGSQRILLELQEGSCVGLRLLTGSAGPCGTADVEITVDDAAKSGITLNSLSGVADLGASFAAPGVRFDAGRLAAARYGMQTAGAAGHGYAVKLSNGQAGLLTIVSLRNPGHLSAAACKVFRANAVRILRRIGGNTGPADPDDVAGTKTSLFLEVTVQTH